ncbi:MAG: HI0074 family nucleotidyltransferase substrate-binding subunit [Flexibacteraceae bacterium]
MEFDNRWQTNFAKYKIALKSLESGLKTNQLSELEMDGLLHRFEFTWELAWQTLQDVLVIRGITTIKGPNPVVQKAGNLQIISNLVEWDNMRQDRNRASHTYDAVMVNEIVNKIKSDYLDLFLDLEKTLNNEPE